MLPTIETLFDQIQKVAKQKVKQMPYLMEKNSDSRSKQYYLILVGRQLSGKNNQKLNMRQL